MGTLRVIYEAEDGQPVVMDGVRTYVGDETGFLYFRGDDGRVMAAARAGRVVEVRDMADGAGRGGRYGAPRMGAAW